MSLRYGMPDIGITLPPLPVVPLYSGSAQPGTVITIHLYDGHGRQIGESTSVTDAGGNWLVGFPMVVLQDYPHTISITQQPCSYNLLRGGYNLRIYFSPCLISMDFYSQPLSLDSVLRIYQASHFIPFARLMSIRLCLVGMLRLLAIVSSHHQAAANDKKYPVILVELPDYPGWVTDKLPVLLTLAQTGRSLRRLFPA